MKCRRCGFDSEADICARCEREIAADEKTAGMAVAIYQGNKVMRGQDPATIRLFSRFKEDHRDYYTPEQWAHVEETLRSGRDWIITGSPGMPAQVLSAVIPGTRAMAYYRATLVANLQGLNQ